MEGETQFRYFVELLHHKGIDTNQFEKEWLQLKSSDSLFCPLCFTQNYTKEKIVALDEKNGSEPVKCTTCKHVFNIPKP
jgi:predicted Zn finger-like uncharacterized protein